MYTSCKSGVLLCFSFYFFYAGKAFLLVFPFIIPENVGLTNSGWTSVKNNST